jgi:6-pyruvoyltetrahydropterin/6-carboxytetrahydropterin synthase
MLTHTTITKRLEIDAGHRLLKHEGKCRHVHGHRYAFEISVSAAKLDDVGRVVDFGVIKERVGAWLDNAWDHAFIAQEGDPIVWWLVSNQQRYAQVDCPPTAENLARLVFEKAVDLLPPTVSVRAVRCWETPTSSADYTGTTVGEADRIGRGAL